MERIFWYTNEKKSKKNVYFVPGGKQARRNAVLQNYLPLVIYACAFQAFANPVIYFLADQKEKGQEKVASEFQKQKTSVVLPKMESNDHAQIITVSCDDLTEKYQENDDVVDDMYS